MLYSFGKILLIIGGLLIFIGFVFFIIGKIGIIKIPGDIMIKKDNFVFYFPLTTCILLSIFLTIIFNLFRRR